MEVKSRYSFTTWFHLVFGTLICIITIVLSITTDLLKKTPKFPLPTFIPLIVLFVLGIYLIHANLKYAAVIQIHGKKILLKYILGKAIELSENDIQEITLFKTGYFNNTKTIITSIDLKDGEKISIPDEAYQKSYKLRQIISANFKEKVSDYPINQELKIPGTIIPDETYKFAGNLFLTLNFLLFFGLTILLISSFSKIISEHPLMILILIPVLFAFYIIFGHQLHYFIIRNENLIVRNHFFPWKKKVFSIRNILSMNFEHIPRRSTSIRVTTSDLKSRTYSAGSLTEEKWQLLITALKEFGVVFLK